MCARKKGEKGDVTLIAGVCGSKRPTDRGAGGEGGLSSAQHHQGDGPPLSLGRVSMGGGMGLARAQSSSPVVWMGY